MGIFYLCRSLGYLASVNIRLDKPTVYTINLTPPGGHQQRSPTVVKKIVDLGVTEQYVYDLETENHHFHAGVGQMIVHNTDGTHIRGLVMNLFAQQWPSLLRVEGFLCAMLTPVVKSVHPSTGQQLEFLTTGEFETWRDAMTPAEAARWRSKYFKGLGTSTPEEARDWFRHMRVVRYIWTGPDRAPTPALSVASGARAAVVDMTVEVDDADTEAVGASVPVVDPTEVLTVPDAPVTEADDLFVRGCADALALAFHKKRANDRKAWLERGAPPPLIFEGTTVPVEREDGGKTGGVVKRRRIVGAGASSAKSGGGEPTCEEARVRYCDFVTKDLIHFSLYDVQRSIPSAIDGLKVSQRKALFGCFERNLVKEEVRVAQLAAYVAEKACFHHGEASRQGTIVGMAQDFVGSNNVPLLEPIGQMGSRLAGGSDAASARYIHTRLGPLARLLFPKVDDGILERLTDDGTPVQPKHYLPILPFVLINGANGIGTGYSTSVPCYHPLDVAAAVRRRLAANSAVETENENEELDGKARLHPWYRGFKGVIESRGGPGTPLVSRGIVRREGPAQARILEAPLGLWTEDLKQAVEALIEKHPKDIKGYANASFDTNVDLTLTFASPAAADAWLTRNGDGGMRLETELKLVSPKGLGTTNMHLFDADGRIRRYSSAVQIVKEFVPVRLAGYEARKAAQLAGLRAEIRVLDNRVRFLDAVIAGDILLQRAEGDAELEAELRAKGFEEIEHHGGFKYLTGMPLHSLTRARKAALEGELAGKHARLAELEATSAAALWASDLDAFEAEYRAVYGANDRAAPAASSSSSSVLPPAAPSSSSKGTKAAAPPLKKKTAPAAAPKKSVLAMLG